MANAPRGTRLTLRHAVTREEREVEVLASKPGWKLLVRWGLAGLYLFDAREGREALLSGRRRLPWGDARPPEARRLWHRLEFPGRHEGDENGDGSKA